MKLLGHWGVFVSSVVVLLVFLLFLVQLGVLLKISLRSGVEFSQSGLSEMLKLWPMFYIHRRSSISGNWKANTGSSAVEQIALTEMQVPKFNLML